MISTVQTGRFFNYKWARKHNDNDDMNLINSAAIKSTKDQYLFESYENLL